MTPRPRLRRIGFALENAGTNVVLALTGWIPTVRLIRLAAWLGAALGRRLPMARRRIDGNLQLVRPDMTAAARGDLAAEVGAGLFMTGVEYLRLADLAARPEVMEIFGGAHVTGARAAGRPIIFVTAHFGAWEFIRLAARGLGAETAIIYRAFNNPRFDAMSQKLIAHAGTPVLHKGPAGARGLLRHVAKGGAALILVDQRQTASPLIPFLGREAETATAAADLALRFDAALIPARVRRIEGGLRYDVAFEAPVPHSDSVTMMAEVNARIGAWIDADPGQWFWLHRRWALRARGIAARAAAQESARGR
ncbi:MAG: KDO2-lipid IV(A) lauroyltransferase [Paracoccaceae bacterium]|jgi:KDO2-lipid IV(A) lauroyltransferase